MFQIEFSPSTVDITTDMSTLIGHLVSCTSDFKRLSQILNKKSTKVKIVRVQVVLIVLFHCLANIPCY